MHILVIKHLQMSVNLTQWPFSLELTPTGSDTESPTLWSRSCRTRLGFDESEERWSRQYITDTSSYHRKYKQVRYEHTLTTVRPPRTRPDTLSQPFTGFIFPIDSCSPLLRPEPADGVFVLSRRNLQGGGTGRVSIAQISLKGYHQVGVSLAVRKIGLFWHHIIDVWRTDEHCLLWVGW